MTSNDAPMNELPLQSLEHETGYQNVIDVQFVSQALASGARRIRGSQWATEALYPADAPGIIASAYYNYNRSFEVLAHVGEALGHIIRQGETVTVRLAARDETALDAAEEQLRAELPEAASIVANEVAVEFSHWHNSRGLCITSRTMTAPRLTEIETNYPRAVQARLDKLANGFVPGSGGRLLLWHGLPGSGKTWALRALALEWRDWCGLRCVSDPERLLNEPGYLLDLIHMRAGRANDENWRLIVLEDTGELLAADAKQGAGQGLSRLLNVVDGLLGESSQALFVVTTNEDLRSLHPAVARPGRCAQILEFGALSPDEANAWLEGCGNEERVSTPTTLAELFAIRDGVDFQATRRRPVGFR